MPIDLADLIIFATAALALNLTPGNDMMFVLGQSIKSGPRHGVAASLGVAAGSFTHLLLVAAGVAVLLARHPAVFDAIRYAGAAYLLYLAFKAIAAPVTQFQAKGSARPLARDFLDGFLVNVFNPKTIVFMFAFLPPFVRPENGAPLLQLLILGLIFNIGGTAVNIAVSFAAGSIARLLAQSPRAARTFNALSASLFVFLAARMAMERR